MHNVLGAEEVEQLSEVMNEADSLHPFGLAVAADCFGGLEEVLDLGEACLCHANAGGVSQRRGGEEEMVGW